MGEKDTYRSTAVRLFGERCLHCGSREEVKIHHMDGDHDNDRWDNLVPLCQDCHVQLHRGVPPYTVWLSLGQPVITALDEFSDARGLRSRSEAIVRALLEAGDTEFSDTTYTLLNIYQRNMYDLDDR